MQKNDVIQVVRTHGEELRERGVKSLVLYGPVARGEISRTGDIDFFLEIHPPVTFDRFLTIKDYLHMLLGQPVELVMESPDHPNIFPFIQDDAVYIL